MNRGRRVFLRLAASAVAFPALPRVARAQAYPARFVRLVCGFPPGGSNDLYARLIGQSLSERLGQQFIVENRTGAAGSIATGSVAIAPRDGYTLLLTSGADAWNTALYDNLSFDYVRDIAPISGLAKGMAALAVNSTSPINSVPELIAFARSNPGKVSVGSGGVGTTSHVAWAIFASQRGSQDAVGAPWSHQRASLTALRFPWRPTPRGKNLQVELRGLPNGLFSRMHVRSRRKGT